MDHILEEFIEISLALRVHKRAAANIRDQLNIIARATVEGNIELPSLFRTGSSFQSLYPLCQLPPLQSYLRQGEIADLLDSLHEALWAYAQACNDDFLMEDIEAQREIYLSDREVDRVNLKRLLRVCIRRNDNQQLLSDMTTEMIFALRDAIDLEIRSLSQRSDTQTIRLFKDFLLYLDPEPTEVQKLGIQDFTGKVVRISESPISWGAVTAIRKGELYGKNVAIYSRHHYDEDDDSDSEVLKNLTVWASFRHPHILPLLGFTQGTTERGTLGMAFISPWMENQTIDHFVRANPSDDRLKLITEMASGLTYLHSLSPPYVHGLLSTSSVFVDDEKHAIIGGFASTAFEGDWAVSLQWKAPETINLNSEFATEYTDKPANTALDVYSFAMTALEVMTSSLPFDDQRSIGDIIDTIEAGGRPSRPSRKLIHHGLDDRLWSLITRCWAQNPKIRPPMSEVLRELEEMRRLPALNVQDLTSSITFMGSGLGDVRACGAFGDIRMGILNKVGPVALKTLNIKGRIQPELRLTKRFIREASIWNNLKHPNVLPFLGTADPPGLSTCLVSPWMMNGNLTEYVKKYSGRTVLHIARGIAEGLAYLHAHQPNAVIHGDLRGANILISGLGEPLLCDFGLAVILEDLAQMPISSLLQDAGNPRWMAPELLIGEQQVSTASDIWALGMVLLEITSLDIPFHELKNSAQVIVEVHRGGLPSRPCNADIVRRGLTDKLWELMLKCWNQKIEGRPSADEALGVLKQLTSGG